MLLLEYTSVKLETQMEAAEAGGREAAEVELEPASYKFQGDLGEGS